MDDVDQVSDDIRDIFCKYKEKQKVDLLRTLSNVRCCDCGHKSRMQNVQIKIKWYKKMTNFYEAILAILAMLLLLIPYALWTARRYNKARTFGNGACFSSFFWTCDDCSVAF